MTSEENKLLASTKPGTPMGELFRRFWLPAVTSTELVADGSPVRLRILHEDLLAFRDTNGDAGIIEAYCTHRLAPLYFGRNEECGIRCPYHGWKFDIHGNCLDIPSIPKGNNETARKRVSLKAYPTREAGGVLWVYMGPKDREPPFPRFESTLVAEGFGHASRWIQRSNWLAGLEGELDSAHISWLHRYYAPEANPIKGGGSETVDDSAPDITLRETDYGFLYGARRSHSSGANYWRVTQWMVPMFSLIPRNAGEFCEGAGRAWVPIDDDNVTTFHFYYRTDRPIAEEEEKYLASGQAFPPRLAKGSVRLGEASPIDTFLTIANLDNDYLMDRSLQADFNFTGIWGANEQDRALQESMGMVAGTRLVDRSREHLVGSDEAIGKMRRRLLNMAKAMAEGREPDEPAGADFGVRAISKMSELSVFDELRARHLHEFVAPNREAEHAG
ncbi:Rieske 2Fe-2S domain-containing protein [Sphingomonas sp.]|uniref:Rieske 2Fe-2S domain-containing protein n=1 Tax=Sphingomonas sp. TaxID=28214 RepID=UPI002B96E1DF|nr:Rieske 2Fe-2S domain-containing protein [Sphingomonas sp.]HWK35446.1 Rieske 2Fe-2S domain-containing protein [Sphingomonas sp.]